jgi:hypothetical protein
MIVIFTNAFKGNVSDEIAINSEVVVSVYPVLTENNRMITDIFTLNDKTFSVEEDYKTVIARLNGAKIR